MLRMSGHEHKLYSFTQEENRFSELVFLYLSILFALFRKNHGWQKLLNYPVFKSLSQAPEVSTQILYMKS